MAVSTSAGSRSSPVLASRSTAIPVCSEKDSVSRSSAAARPKSSSTFGRSSTARRRTSWSVATTSSRSSATAARFSSFSSASSSGFRPSRIDVSAWPVSSWSSRASRRRSSSCASTTRRSTSRATRSERSTATAARAVEDAPALGARPGQHRADELLALRAGRGRETELLGAGRQEGGHQPRVEKLLEPTRDEVEDALEVGLGRERVPDLDQRLELPRPLRRRLVQARVLDRDGGLGREEPDELLVVLGEVLALRLLGQVEVAVGDAAQHDRHA